MKPVLITLLVLLLGGCGTAPVTVTVPIKVPVPVKCTAEVPQRPVMPTEVLPTTAAVFDKVRAALAEIDFREGYEVELLAALKSCL